MTPPAPTLASPQETVAILDRLDEILVLLAAQFGHIVCSGPLTETQQAHVAFGLGCVARLRELFAAERDRLSGVRSDTHVGIVTHLPTTRES